MYYIDSYCFKIIFKYAKKMINNHRTITKSDKYNWDSLQFTVYKIRTARLIEWA